MKYSLDQFQVEMLSKKGYTVNHNTSIDHIIHLILEDPKTMIFEWSFTLNIARFNDRIIESEEPLDAFVEILLRLKHL